MPVSKITGQNIGNIETYSEAYRLWSNGSTGGDQYFLVENRQQTGYDSYLPGNGLLIYHIDESRWNLTNNNNQWYPGYTSYGHYLVALEQADGLWGLEKNSSSGNAGDPYPGSANNGNFTSLTLPGSRDYDDNSSCVQVKNISISGLTMTADLSVLEHTIIASAGPHGTISPSGVVIVDDGGTPTFTITPDTGYHVFDVLVGGASVGAVTSYTFNSVTADSTISVTFAINRNSISGKVTKDATGLADVTITLSSLDLPSTPALTATTGSDGNYSFTGVVAGNYTLTPTLTGYVFTPAQIELNPFVATAPLTVIDIVAYLPFEITVLPSGTPNPVVENGSVLCKVTTVPDAVGYLWTTDRGHFEDSGVRTSDQHNPTWVADISMTDSTLFEVVELKVIAYAADGRSVSASYSQQVNKLPVSVVNSDSGGVAVGPLAVGISALLGWWKRRKRDLRVR